jgi:TetR/AcrR family transcriptional regulator, transcriptional repressor for nem operon
MKERPTTRERMVLAALQLFHERGIHATTVDEVLEASNTGKSQFYHYFKNKNGLIHAVLTHFYNRMKEGKISSIRVESWQDLKKWFESFIEYQKKIGFTRSCPVGTIGADLSTEDELLRQDIRLIFESMKNSLRDFFSRMKAKGELDAKADPETLAKFCFTIMQGGLLVSKIERESQTFESAAKHAIRYIDSFRI